MIILGYILNMIKNESFSKNMRFKKIEINELRNNHIKKNKKNIKKKDINSFVRADNPIKEINKDNTNKNINENNIRKNNFNIKTNSNLISLSKSSNNFLNKNRTSKTSEFNIKKGICFENTINNNANSKNKNRYLTCFDNSISSKKIDENKINVLLNDFTFFGENKDKENINTNLQLETNNNKNKILIKVNKINNFHTKNLYIEACEKLKEKIKSNISNEDNKKIENESRGNHILKISTKFMDKKRNTTNIIKKRYKKNFIDMNVENNINNNDTNFSKNNYTALVKSKKFSNSFRLTQKDLFLKNNNIKKNKNALFTENKSQLDSQSSCKIEEVKKNNNKENTDFSSIMNYEQRKIKVFKNKGPINLFETEKNLTLAIDNKKNNIDNIDNITNFKSPKNEDIFKTLSFNKVNNFKNNNRNNNIYNYFSLDLSFKEENDNKNDEKNKNNNNLLLSPINIGKTSNKKINSLSKKRYMSKKSKINLKTENFNFDELNEKLFNMIKNLESQEIKKEIKHCFHSKKNEEGFIKWDIFEKIIQDK